MKTAVCSHTRRHFLAGFAGTALAPLEARTSVYHPLLAVRSSAWQPAPADLESFFTGVRRAGYQRLELAAGLTAGEPRNDALRLLRQNALEPSIVAPRFDRDSILDAARVFAPAGARYIAVTAPAADDRERLAWELNQLARDVERAGLRLLLYPAPADLRDDARGWRHLVSHTETAVVSLGLDVDAAAQAGFDPVTLLDAASPRLAAVILRSRRNGAAAEEVGTGEPDMVRIAAFLKRIAYDGYLVADPAPARAQTELMALSHTRWYIQEVFGSAPGVLPVDMGPHVRTHRK